MAEITPRSPWQVTAHVWHALFLREAMARVTADRIAWFWMLVEPIAHVLLLVGVRSIIGMGRLIPGADFIPWLVVGITSFILWRNQMTKGMNAISANRALFAYRQVHPVDTVIVRSGLEGVLSSTVMMILVMAFVLLGEDILPHDPLKVVAFWLILWLFGAGAGLVTSVVVTVLPESQKFISMISFPLYFLSGVLIPVQYFPHAIRDYLLYNPLVHIIEFIRSGFFADYRLVDGLSVAYLGYWTVGALLLGLLLHVRFKARLMSE